MDFRQLSLSSVGNKMHVSLETRRTHLSNCIQIFSGVISQEEMTSLACSSSTQSSIAQPARAHPTDEITIRVAKKRRKLGKKLPRNLYEISYPFSNDHILLPPLSLYILLTRQTDAPSQHHPIIGNGYENTQ